MLTTQKNRHYVAYFDLLNILACFSVVVLHVNGTVHTFSYEPYWISAMFLESTFYPAVPIFLMLSGATLMDYRDRYNTKTFLLRRFTRTVIPFLFWSLVAIAWHIVVVKDQGLDWVNTPQKLIDNILNSRAMSIYWFFPGLFAIYLALPVLSLIPKSVRLGKKGCFPYMIGVSFLLSIVFPLLGKLCSFRWNSSLCLPVAGGFVIFVLLGYLLSQRELPARQRYALYFAGFFGWLLYFGGTILFSYRTGTFDSTFKGYLGVTGVFMGAAIFELFHAASQKGHFQFSEKTIQLIKTVSGSSFGVYLLHIYWRDILIHLFAIDTTSYIWRFLGPFPVYLLTLLLVLLLKQVPGLRRLLP